MFSLRVFAPAATAISLFAWDAADAQESLDSRLQPGGSCGSSSHASAPALVINPPRVNAQGDRIADEMSNYALAQISEAQVSEVDRIVVRGFDVNPVEYPALPEVEGTRINSGKKTSFVKPEEFPEIANNSFREALATTPGLLVSEEPSSPIINLGYRGLDSQRSETLQVLKDGLSIKNEQFGFPETHYTPILDAVERIEFIRAGASLQFGPQPGGAINFVTKMPRARRAVSFHDEESLRHGRALPEFHRTRRHVRIGRLLRLLRSS